jgi:RND family efflux transporter MFP subunit
MTDRAARNRRLALAGLVLAFTLTVGLWRIRALSEEPSPPEVSSGVPVTVAQVEQRDVPHRVSGIGTVQSLHSVIVRPQVSGVLTHVLFREGQLVEKGALLARIDDRAIAASLMQGQAERARNEAQLRAAQVDLKRYTDLLPQGAVSRQTIDQQAALIEQLKAAIRANDASIAVQELQLSYTRITAPVSGRVGMRRVDPGNLMQAGDEDGLFTVVQIAPISIVFTLPQEMLAAIQPLMQAPDGAWVEAYDRDAGERLAQGRLAMIDNQIDSTSGTIRLRAQFENADGKLWPGQFVAVELHTSVSREAMVVPSRALQTGLEGPFVYRVHEGSAQMARVTVSHRDEDIAVIAQGLSLGDTVVVDGQSRLSPGAAVVPVPASRPTVALPSLGGLSR